MARQASFIWAPEIEEQRLTVVAFRYELDLESVPESAEFNCFANTHYHVKVNGAQVGFGPARSMPTHPSYDTYDISSFLKPGKNVVAVLVAHTAGYGFHHIPMPGAFVAWGQCAGADLSTDSDKWRCCVSAGHDVNPPRWSFAVPAIEICDERDYPRGWDQVGEPAGDWIKPIVIDDSGWGPLVPREMEPLSNAARKPFKIVQAFTHSDAETIYGFRVVKDYKLKELPYEKAKTCAYTWIHSDSPQQVEMGTWWGEHYLNGQELEQTPGRADQIMRQNTVLNLEAGWNLLFIHYGMMHAYWECQVALPKNIKVDADRGEGHGDVAFYVSETLKADEFSERFSMAPQNQEYLSQLDFNWSAKPFTPICVSPERRIAWAVPDKQLSYDEDCFLPFTVSANTPTSIIYDFGRIALGRLSLDVDAPAGTVFDIYYSEDLNNNRSNCAKNVVSYTADRRIAAGSGRLEWFFPRGAKFVEVSVAGHETDVVIKDISIIEMRYPYTDDGSFDCSDPNLTTLWEYGVETLRCNSEDVITDCPWRERTMYGGDLLVEMAVATVHSRDLKLLRRCIDVYTQCQHPETGGLPGRAPCLPQENPLGEYQLMVVIAASWYVRLSNDIEFAKRIEDRIDKVMSGFVEKDPETGLFYFKNSFIEHTKVQRSGLVSAANAALAGAYRAYADFLRRIGRDSDADAAMQAGADLDKAILKTFWDAERKLFKTGVGQDDAPGNPYQLHASFYPGCFDSTTEEIDRALQKSYITELMKLADDPQYRKDGTNGRIDHEFSAYGAFYMLEHLAKMGRADIAEDTIKRFYGDMLRHPTGTIWEHFNDGKSLCHAWSAAPTWYCSSQILGVNMAFNPADNVDGILIEPQSDSLTWAHGTVPHPRGDVFVSWEIRGQQLHLRYRAPEGVAVEIKPRGRLAELDLCLERLTA